MAEDDASRNRAYWDAGSEVYQRDHAAQLNRADAGWGVWHAPESELGILGDVAGADVLELGCGGAQWSIKLARAGARPVGLDNSGAQLAAARRLVAEAGVRVPLVHAAAETVPFADRSFDVVFCDHGAMSFADPARTVPEAARVLRPGGLLAFNMATPFIFMAWDPQTDAVGERLHRSAFDLGRFGWAEGVVEYQRSYGSWIRLFRASGLIVLDLVELRPPPEATTTYPEYAPLDWARRWPAEHVWRLRKP